MTPRSRVPPGPGLCGHSLLCPQAESVAERELSAKGLQAHSSTREPLLFSQTSQNGGTGVPLPALLLSEVTPGSSIVTSGRVPVATVQPLSQRCCPYLSPVASSQPPRPILSRFSLPTSNPMVPLFESLPAVLPNYQVRNSFTGSFPMETDACSWCCVSQKQVGLTAQLLSDGGRPAKKPAFQCGLCPAARGLLPGPGVTSGALLAVPPRALELKLVIAVSQCVGRQELLCNVGGGAVFHGCTGTWSTAQGDSDSVPISGQPLGGGAVSFHRRSPVRCCFVVLCLGFCTWRTRRLLKGSLTEREKHWWGFISALPCP